MNKSYFFLLLFIAIFFVGCSAVPKADTELDTRIKNLTPPSGKALVYILRPNSYGSMAVFNTTVNGEFIGSTGGKRYIYTILAPGTYTFSTKAENRKELPIVLEADQTYFLEQQVHMGIMSARNKLVRIDERDGRFKLQKCFLSDKNVYQGVE